MSDAAVQIHMKDLRLHTDLDFHEEENNLRDVTINALNNYSSEALKSQALCFADSVSFRLAKHKF